MPQTPRRSSPAPSDAAGNTQCLCDLSGSQKVLHVLFSNIPNLRKYKLLAFLLVSTPKRVTSVQLLIVVLAAGVAASL